MNCVNCGAPMKLHLDRQQFYCEYCASIYFPERNKDGIRILEESSKINCPVCEIPLVYGFIDHTQILCCVNCRGMLIDQEVFLMVIDYLRAYSAGPPVDPPPVNLSELERQVDCPQCFRKMSTHLYGGPGNLVIDNCVNCSLLWLDNREFERIIHTPGRDRRYDVDDEDL